VTDRNDFCGESASLSQAGLHCQAGINGEQMRKLLNNKKKNPQ